MSRTERTPHGRVARRVVPMIVGAAVAAASVILLSGNPASATQQVTVAFTSDGPSPASVTIQPGDQVTFRNDVDPNGQTLLGVVTGAVKSVTIDVANASNPGFSLAPGQSRTLTYSQPVRTTYTATYRTTTLLLLPGRAMDTTGTLLVGKPAEAAPAASAGPTAATGGQSGPAPADRAAVGRTPDQQAPAASGQQAAAGSERVAGTTGPQVNYTPGPAQVAAGQMPGAGSEARTPAGSDVPPVDTAPGGVAALPGLTSTQGHPVDRASADRSLGSLGLPAITAVVLLSMVSAGLVRTIMVRHTSLA